MQVTVCLYPYGITVLTQNQKKIALFQATKTMATARLLCKEQKTNKEDQRLIFTSV